MLSNILNTMKFHYDVPVQLCARCVIIILVCKMYFLIYFFSST